MNRKMIRGIVFILVLVSGEVTAQNTPFFSHYMFNPVQYNPGYMGVIQDASVSFTHRSQWVGYQASFGDVSTPPSTQLVSIMVPTTGSIAALGANVIYDVLGPDQYLTMQLGVAITKEFRFGTFSLGVMPSLISRTLDFSQLRTEVQDPLVPVSGRESQTVPDLAAGIFFQNRKEFFLGIGVSHILNPNINFGLETETAAFANELPTNIYLHAGQRIPLNRELSLTSSVLVRTDQKTFTADVNAIFTLRDKMWAGASYRRGESAILLLGYSFLENNRLKLGYSFDYVVQDQDAKQPSSHEVFLRYDLPGFLIGGKKAVKTPRFSF